MFGKTRKKLERQWMLDVRSRAKPLQAVRIRMAVSALAISAGIVLVLFFFWKGGEYALDRFVYTNPTLSVAQVQIETDGIIPNEQILAWSSVRKGENLLTLELGRIKRDLELVPLIEAATVDGASGGACHTGAPCGRIRRPKACRRRSRTTMSV